MSRAGSTLSEQGSRTTSRGFPASWALDVTTGTRRRGPSPAEPPVQIEPPRLVLAPRASKD